MNIDRHAQAGGDVELICLYTAIKRTPLEPLRDWAARFPAARVFGVFVARRVFPPDPLDDIFKPAPR